MNKHAKQKVDSLMSIAKAFTDTYTSQVMLATIIATQCLEEAYRSSSLESARIDFWEMVLDEFKIMIEDLN